MTHTKPGRCPSCSVLIINGLRSHEHGCPDQWRDETRECKWCGADFAPEHTLQRFCENSCYAAFNGLGDAAEEAGL